MVVLEIILGLTFAFLTIKIGGHDFFPNNYIKLSFLNVLLSYIHNESIYFHIIIFFTLVIQGYYPLFFEKNFTKIFSIFYGIRKIYEGFFFISDSLLLLTLVIIGNHKNIFIFVKNFREFRSNGYEHISFNKKKDITECPICLEQKADISLACGHSFDKKCLRESISKNSEGVIYRCPLCRKKYNTLNLNALFFMQNIFK